MRTSVVFVLALTAALAACRGDPLGAACENDEACGPGFDCFPDVCVQVCTKDDECRTGQRCHRYHCVEPGQENQLGRPQAKKISKGSSAASRPNPRPSPATPPVPDATAAELRAIRRELELIRQEQTRIVGLLKDPKAPPQVAPAVGQTTIKLPPPSDELPSLQPRPPANKTSADKPALK